jgi:hypothetical protein
VIWGSVLADVGNVLGDVVSHLRGG